MMNSKNRKTTSQTTSEPDIWKPKIISKDLPVGTQISSNLGSLAGRPILAQKIAYCISCWANIERSLCEIFAYTIENDPLVAAKIIFEEHIFSARIKLVNKFLRERFGTDLKDQAMERFVPALKLSDERNNLVHGVFIVVSHYPDAVIRIEGWGNDEEWFLYDVETLDALLQKFMDAEKNVRDIFFFVAEMVQRQQHEEGRPAFSGQMLLAGVFHQTEPKTTDEPQPPKNSEPQNDTK